MSTELFPAPDREPVSSPPVETAPISPSIISLQEVWKIYDTGEVRVEALKEASMEVPAGDFVAIMGASGSGKSTLLNILGCLDRPTKGVYLLDQVDVSTYSAARRADIRNQKIGFVFQNFNLLARTSVWENVEAPMLYSGLAKSERATRIDQVLEVVGIPDKARALPSQLSGGEQQRVAVARALVNQPTILLADEPTGNLDSTTSDEILQFLQSLNRQQGITLLMVTHDRDIAGYASRIVHMKDGYILSEHP